MFFVFFFYASQIFSIETNNLNTTFCICELNSQFDCSTVCDNHQNYNFDSVDNILTNYTYSHIVFLIAGTNQDSTNSIPIFDLSQFENLSINVYISGLQTFSDNQESIILKEGKVGKNVDFFFTNVNIHIEKGRYIFEKLNLSQTSFTPKENSEAIWKQSYLISDFPSLSHLSKATEHIGPKTGALIKCDKDVNRIQFLKDLQISFFTEESDTQTIFDLSQVGRKYNTTILIKSHHLNLTFLPLPKDQSEIPKVIFSMNSNSNVYIDSDQFDESNMIIDKITFLHKSKTLYINSRNGTIPPTFNYIGSGYTFVNDRTRNFYRNYCICTTKGCSSKCGRDYHIINDTALQTIEATVVGNPNDNLTYYIVGTTEAEGSYPIFNIEHFEYKKFTLKGHTLDEHVGFYGDGTGAIGQFFISSLTIHTQHADKAFLFPNVTFRKVKVYPIQENHETQSDDNTGNPITFFTLKSYYLNIDYVTLKQFTDNRVIIESPAQGMEVDAHLNKSISLSFYKSNQVEFNNFINLSFELHTTFSLYTDSIVFFYIYPTFPEIVTSIPKLRIYLNCSGNQIYFPQYWPSQLSDISAQITIVHGNKDVHVNGDYDKETKTYTTKPPIVDHEGNGPFYFNGHLSNYKSLYCICEGNNCPQLCTNSYNKGQQNQGVKHNHKSLWPPISFSDKSIAKTVIENPTRHIEYFIHGSTPTQRPFFQLFSFQSKSFSIIGCPDDPLMNNQRQYISLEGLSQFNEITSTSVSHIFSDVNILLATPDVYFFHNAVFTNCEIVKSPSVPKKSQSNYKIIQSGMTIDMPTLHSLGSNISKDISFQVYSYIRVNGNDDLSKIVIDDSSHMNLFNSNGSLKGRVDVSLLQKKHVELRTNCGDTQENPIIIEWGANNGIKAPKKIPNFMIDVSNMYGDDVFIKFVGRKWHGKFRNLTEHIKFRCGPINLHILSEKKFDSKGRGIKIIPPFVGFEGDGDIYIDEEKQISSKVYGNGIMNLAGSFDYEDDLVNILTPIKLFFILLLTCSAVFFSFILGIKIKKWIIEHERYIRIAHNLSALQDNMPHNVMNDLQIEQFHAI